MMEDVGIPDNIQKAIVDNHEPNAGGMYPDWANTDYVFKRRELKLVKLFEYPRKCGDPLVSKRTPYKIMDHRQKKCLG